jgi:hypothetical protein
MKNLSLSAFSTIPQPHRKHIGFLVITCAGMLAGQAHAGRLDVPDVILSQSEFAQCRPLPSVAAKLEEASAAWDAAAV